MENTLIQILSTFLILYSVYQLGSIAGLFSERAGVANIAIEGNMILGAAVFSIIWSIFSDTSLSPEISLAISILLGTFLSATYMMLLGYVTSRYMADHVIVGTGMNLLAPALSLFIFGFMVSPQAYIVPTYTHWKIFIDGYIGFNKLNVWFFVVTIVITIIAAFFLNKTTFGLRLKSAGENPFSLETAGVSVSGTKMKALFIAGLLSSLAGAFFATKGQFNFTVNGSGFLALGILILGQWRISGTVIGSVILALFISIFNNFATIAPDLSDMQYLMNTIPFIIPIIGLMVFKSHGAPAAVGTNFKKDQR